ncbi:GAF domain-containing sensor histidine kinase [uncultured Desulfosarcina sp.]|uniref:GAF domain-containing sensor histidine kinase n=1 Tax=uncultured Desulfosarcina sp. TaxID=218289 RepID=UPI0029C822E8|nr:GAF domain-containing sensor histidine kinase [uncultured Desulfosarcina sp.]
MKRTVLPDSEDSYERRYHKFASLFNFAPIGYLTIDRDGMIQDINNAAAATLNASCGSLTGRSLLDFIHRDDQDGFYYHKLKCRKIDDTPSFELKMKRADGFFFDAQLQMQSLSMLYGSEPQYSVALVDISEHVRHPSAFALQRQCLEIACTAKDIDTLLQAYVRLVKRYAQCDAAGIRILDEAGNIPYRAWDGFNKEFCAAENRLSVHTDPCMCVAVILGETDPGRPFFTENGSFYINTTRRPDPAVPPGKMCTATSACNTYGYQSVALVPVPIDNAIHGLIHVADRRKNVLPLRVVQVLEAVASRLGLTIQRLRLESRLGETVKTLNELSSHLMTVQEDEQRRIAMELHDGCGQDLNVLKLKLKALQNRLPPDAADLEPAFDQLQDDAGRIIDALRNIAHGLKPAALESLGLSAATRQCIREFSDVTGIEAETQLERLDGIADPMARICLFRIFQEALTNIHKHARATWVLFTVIQDDHRLEIRIVDNGVGFDLLTQSGDATESKGMGLSAMALRCRMIGAKMSLDSEPGRGTRLTIRLPLPAQEASR